MARIYQLVAGFRIGDAISNEAVLIQKLLSEHGVENYIACPRSNAAPGKNHSILNVEDLPASIKADDIALLHLSIGSRANEVFVNLPCRRIILYHNVTPPQFFERINPEMAGILATGLAEVKKLASLPAEVYADSQFNANELLAMGYPSAKVLPLIIDENYGKQAPDPAMLERLRAPGTTNILFVGRLVPNKRHDRLIHAFSYYQHYINPNSALIIAGAGNNSAAYEALLRGTVYELALRNVTFTGFVTDAELASCYAAADAFVCTSDHEGFCAPLLEAMAWHIPVFAQDAGAMAETMDGAGILFKDAHPATLAETVSRVLSNPELRAAVVKKQDERMARFQARDPWAELSAILFPAHS